MRRILHIPSDTWGTIIRALAFSFCCALMLIVIWPVAQMLPPFYRDVFSGILACLGAFLLSLLFLKWAKLTTVQTGLAPGRKTVKRMLIGFAIGSLLVTTHILLLYAIGHIKFTRIPATGNGIIFFNLLLYLAFALREEIAYRAFPLQSLAYKIAPWKAQLIMATAFALEHKVGGYTWLQAFAGAALGAILFGVAALKTKGIALPLGIHASWNFGQWLMGFKDRPGCYQFIIEKGYEQYMDVYGRCVYILLMVTAIVILLKSKRGHTLL